MMKEWHGKKTKRKTHSWAGRTITDCPDTCAPDSTVSASPIQPLSIGQGTYTTTNTAATSIATNIGSAAATRSARSGKWAKTSESSLLLGAFASTHTLLLQIQRSVRWCSAQQACC